MGTLNELMDAANAAPGMILVGTVTGVELRAFCREFETLKSDLERLEKILFDLNTEFDPDDDSPEGLLAWYRAKLNEWGQTANDAARSASELARELSEIKSQPRSSETKDATPLAERISKTLLDDVTSRRGWRHEWEGFHADIKEEIRAEWLRLVKDELSR